MTTPRDTLGVTIRPGDTVTVTAWGGATRLADAGRRATVTTITTRGLLDLAATTDTADPIARGRGVHPGHVAVARRDGAPGHEGNRPDHS